MLPNRVVAHFADGRILKGTTQDFLPARELFHLIESEGGSRPVAVPLGDLKAVFFVKDLIGNPAYTEVKAFSGPADGRKLQVTFADGETMVGSSADFRPDGPGFFLVPADPKSNNDRVFVVMRTVTQVSELP